MRVIAGESVASRGYQVHGGRRMRSRGRWLVSPAVCFGLLAGCDGNVEPSEKTEPEISDMKDTAGVENSPQGPYFEFAGDRYRVETSSCRRDSSGRVEFALGQD